MKGLKPPKGKPNKIFVDGKTLNQIAEENGLKLDTVHHRWSRGMRTYEELAKQSHIQKEVNNVKREKRVYNNYAASERVMERIWEKDVNLAEMARQTGVSRTAIYNFLYTGMDISSMRLAKICKYLELSMDTVMGI